MFEYFKQTPPETTEANDELPQLYFLLSALIHAIKTLNAKEKTTISNALQRNADTATPDQAKRLRAIARTITEHPQTMSERGVMRQYS